jgi:hypothetical protein
MPEEELRRPVGGIASVAIARRLCIGSQAQQGRQALVERGVGDSRSDVAVPAAVGPLPADEIRRQLVNPRLVEGAQMRGHEQRVAFLAAAPASSAVDDLNTLEVTFPGERGEDGRKGLSQAAGLRRDAEIRQRNEPPVGACPLPVPVPAEPSVLFLAGEEARNKGTAADLRSRGEDLGIVRGSAQKLREGPVPDRRLLRAEQPFDRRVARGHGHVASIRHQYIRNLYVNGKVVVNYAR